MDASSEKSTLNPVHGNREQFDKLLEKYVKERGGSKVIRKVLIANNGNAATKAIRSVRRWCYETFGSEHAIQFVVMVTPEDLAANAEFIHLAHQYVEVPGGSNNNNYANVQLIVDIAERLECDAVWAGWGHASENPRLPTMLSQTKTKIAFVGPNADAMSALGDKIASTIIAQSAGVPVVPWSGDGLKCSYAADGEVAAPLFKQACVFTVEEAKRVCTRIGYPVMIKASEGGGGKGIRKCLGEESLVAAFRQVQGEVPGSPIFIMRLCPHARHLEVQLLADSHGNAIALRGRDCSVQRRHQKIIEEGPIIAATAEQQDQLERAAVALAKEVGYTGVGTVEYLYSPEGTFYFLELNPRLQVEHPVTEWITNVNLPSCQIQVAMGIPLGRIPDIRKYYGVPLDADTAIDFDKQRPTKPNGHVIACRITAENPDKGFQPSSGRIHELTFRTSPNLWGYFSLKAHGNVHEFADSQFGHVFAWGADRDAARKTMVMALKELTIRGDIRNTVEYLIRLVEHPEYVANQIDTEWLDGLIQTGFCSARPSASLAVICGALDRAYAMANSAKNAYVSSLERGQVPSRQSLGTFNVELIYEDFKYQFAVTRSSPSEFRLTLNKTVVYGEVRNLSDGGLLMLIDGRKHIVYNKEEVGGVRLIIDGMTCIFPKEYDPTQVRATMAGKLVRYLVEDGDHVGAREPFAEIEVMKMYLPLLAPESGTVKLLKTPGGAIEAGELIAALALDDPSTVRRAVMFTGTLPPCSSPRNLGDKPHQIFASTVQALEWCLRGYDVGKNAVSELRVLAKNPYLPLYELKDVLSSLQGRIPAKIHEELIAVCEEWQSTPDLKISDADQYLDSVVSKVDAALGTITMTERTTMAPLLTVVEKYRQGMISRYIGVVHALLSGYIQVERAFTMIKRSEDRAEDVLLDLSRSEFKGNLDTVVEYAMSHQALEQKNDVALSLLLIVEEENCLDGFTEILEGFAAFVTRPYSSVSLRARDLLFKSKRPTFEKRRLQTGENLRHAVSVPTADEREHLLDSLARQFPVLFDTLFTFFTDPEDGMVAAAMETYLRRAYRQYKVHDMHPVVEAAFSRISWQFELDGENPEAGIAEKDGSNAPHADSNADTGMMDQSLTRHREKKTWDSANNLLALDQSSNAPRRFGLMAVFPSKAQALKYYPAVLDCFLEDIQAARVAVDPKNPLHVLNVFVKWDAAEPFTEEQTIDALQAMIQKHEVGLVRGGVRYVTVIVAHDQGTYPGFYTFRQKLGFKEDATHRHIDPALSFQLELWKLSNFNIKYYPSTNRQVHVYYAEGKTTGPGQDKDARFFVRAMARRSERFADEQREIAVAVPSIGRVFNDSLDTLELAIRDSRFSHTNFNHLFMYILHPVVDIDLDQFEILITRLATMHAPRLWKLRVRASELKCHIGEEGRSKTFRFFVTNPTGHVVRVDSYEEVRNNDGSTTLVAVHDPSAPLNGHPAEEPYPVLDLITRKRITAQGLRTTYAYDFPELFEKVLVEQWRSHMSNLFARGLTRPPIPEKFLRVTELMLNANGDLEEVQRAPGLNNIAMLAWRFRMCTVEAPQGRDIIVIANDITHLSGSFGPEEDNLFFKASELARREGIPRIYLAANSGARIGLAKEVKDCFRVAWNDPSDEGKGYKYLYLSPDDYKRLSDKNSIQAKFVMDDGEQRWVITDIIGEEDGLGVENLSGSGLIAGETSRAYEEIFTLTYVTSRTVGIGAYLVRLGQRVIQNENPPIILTGYQALNKVLGRQVYTSNDQLGGTKIMYTNGVSHMTCDDDLTGVRQMIQWMSFVPLKRGMQPPKIDALDSFSRSIDFAPGKSPYDPIHMLAGVDSAGYHVSGFFDKDTFVETLGGWAKTVTAGRARLGGIPVGVISVETRMVETVVPADPATPNSEQSILQQAGQVWFPDSAYKTAQCIRDFDMEGLPLMIFANWRGFSGGMRDMLEEVLKFGSYIVDHLRAYRQPVFIYLPPNAELRGGAWVVVDSQINSEMIEMYADPSARGGVLEPEGTIEIKFRKADLIKTMHRLDAELKKLQKQLKECESRESEVEIKLKIAQRQEKLLPMYTQVATKFADLHDTPGRMKAKNVIRGVVEWAKAREFFYWRLQRRLLEIQLQKEMRDADPRLSTKECLARLKKLISQWDANEMRSVDALWEDDKYVSAWMEQDKLKINKAIDKLRQGYIAHTVAECGKLSADGVYQGFLCALKNMDEVQRAAFVQALTQHADNNFADAPSTPKADMMSPQISAKSLPELSGFSSLGIMQGSSSRTGTDSNSSSSNDLLKGWGGAPKLTQRASASFYGLTKNNDGGAGADSSSWI